MQTAHEMFIHELQDMLDAENKLIEALGVQAEESNNPQVKKAFVTHQKQTEKQVQRLEQAFQSLGEEAEETECAGIAGLIEEHDKFKEDEDPSPDLLDIFNVGAGVKVERYEISAYESLVRMAKMMRHSKAEKLLTQNLKEEQQTLSKLESLGKKLKPERLLAEDQVGAKERIGRRGRRAA
jgi:ferritin-like metal-binding protein YciE